MRRDCRGCRERFPRKDPGVFDLLGSSLSCDTTGLTPPAEYLCLRVAEPLGRPVLTPEEARAPSRNNVLPHTANATETRFSLEVLAVDALSRHVRRVTIFQLSNRRRRKKTGAASRFFSRSTPSRRLQRFPPLPLKRLPQLFCGISPQIPTFLQQWWSLRHLASTVDEDLWISDPGGVVPMESPDPVVIGVDQPSFFHHATSGHQPSSTSRRTIQFRHFLVRCSP